VELCENAQCKWPHRVEYYEAPNDVSLFRATELWEECLVEVANLQLDTSADVRSCTYDGDLLKRADAEYLKRS
jgi:hypothetical protein